MSERERMSDELKDVESAMQPEDSGPPDTGSGPTIRTMARFVDR